ncbi:MAG TPA: hypothetical protein VLH09_08645 [Bryobacteraceae bacterium]|nr:hypothetical protein [Bryobacteraceae bacterium]
MKRASPKRQRRLALAAGFGIEDGVQLQMAQGAQHRGHVTMRHRAGDVESGLQSGQALVFAFQDLAEALAEEDGGRGSEVTRYPWKSTVRELLNDS